MITLMLLIVMTRIPRHKQALVMMVNTFVNLCVRVKCGQIKKGEVCLWICVYVVRFVTIIGNKNKTIKMSDS